MKSNNNTLTYEEYLNLQQKQQSIDFRPLLNDGDISRIPRDLPVSLGLANIVAKGYYDPVNPTRKQKAVIKAFELLVRFNHEFREEMKKEAGELLKF